MPAKRKYTNKSDILETITARIETALEAGTAPWVKPWRDIGGHGGIPRNGISGKQYRGINVPQLWLTAQSLGYQSGYWLTYKQATDLGGHVTKGEKSTPIVFWKIGERTERDTSTGEETRHSWAMARAYHVFNLEQCEEVTLPKKLQVTKPVEVLDDKARFPKIEAFIRDTGISFSEQGDRACYIPSIDRVQMPTFEQFETSDYYYGAAFHELTHATGAKHRLDRLKMARFGSADYAKEELVAECGSAFLSAILGVNVNGLDHHASYLQNWLDALKNDRKFLVSAFSQAHKAADWLMEAANLELEEAA